MRSIRIDLHSLQQEEEFTKIYSASNMDVILVGTFPTMKRNSMCSWAGGVYDTEDAGISAIKVKFFAPYILISHKN